MLFSPVTVGHNTVQITRLACDALKRLLGALCVDCATNVCAAERARCAISLATTQCEEVDELGEEFPSSVKNLGTKREEDRSTDEDNLRPGDARRPRVS